MSKMLSSRCSVLTAALIGSTLALSSTLISKPAFAGTKSANLNVSANVVNSCDIFANSLNFGSYDSRQDRTSSGSISTNCTNGASATITLGQGSNAKSGSTDAAPLRQLNSANDEKLAYELYQDNAGTVWGNTPETGLVITGTGTSQDKTVYGKIPASQSVPVGSYEDAVLATVTF